MHSALRKLRDIRAKEAYEQAQRAPVKPDFQVIDITEELPWHESRKWQRRSMTKINKVLVHQAAMDNATAENVNTYHITPTSDRDGDGVIEAWEKNHLTDKGAPHICYHFVIEKDGTIFQTNQLTDVTWHARGHNTSGIGILVAGYFKGPGHEQAGDPTKDQKYALVFLLDYLYDLLSNVDKENYLGHCEVDPTNKPACPGDELMDVLNEWRTS